VKGSATENLIKRGSERRGGKKMHKEELPVLVPKKEEKRGCGTRPRGFWDRMQDKIRGWVACERSRSL